MTSDRRNKGSHRIPIRFSDAENENESPSSRPAEMDSRLDPDIDNDDFSSAAEEATADEALGLTI